MFMYACATSRTHCPLKRFENVSTVRNKFKPLKDAFDTLTNLVWWTSVNVMHYDISEASYFSAHVPFRDYVGIFIETYLCPNNYVVVYLFKSIRWTFHDNSVIKFTKDICDFHCIALPNDIYIIEMFDKISIHKKRFETFFSFTFIKILLQQTFICAKMENDK